MYLHVYSLERTLYEGEVDSVSLPAEDGEITILPSHTQLVSTLKSGPIKIKNKEKNESLTISEGFAYTDGLQLIVLSD